MKKKSIIILSIIIILLLLFVGIGYFIYHKEQELFQSNFYEQVLVKQEIMLYDSTNQVIGTIYPNTILSLEKKQGTKYKLQDMDYYIDYHHLEKTEKQVEQSLLVFNQNIVTSNTFHLYQNNELQIKINYSVEFPIYQIQEDSYTVFFLSQYYDIKKEDVVEIKEVTNTEEEYAISIPVLSFVNIREDNLYNDSIRKEKQEEIITYLNTQSLHYINPETYNLWINGSINLPKNSILLLGEEENIEQNIYVKEEDISLNDEPSVIYHKNAYKINNLINLADIKEILKGKPLVNVQIDDTKLATSIPVLNYHFFYGDGQICNELICLHRDKLEQHFKYLNEHGYKTLTMREYIDWYDGKIELPEKSVLLTVDDGAMGTDTLLPELLNQYQIHATLFLITAWWPKEKYVSNYLDIESHGYDIHIVGNCGKEKLLCLNYDEKVSDFKKSIEMLSTSQAFCYPFYKYDSLSMEALKEVGFEVAFWGGGYASTRKSNRYLIPRYPIYTSITLQEFINML